MATFVYKAKKNSAETVTGKMTADSQEEAIELINQLGFLPVSIEVQEEQRGKESALPPKKIKSKDVYIFSRQLSNLLKSGTPLLRALNILEGQMSHSVFKKIVYQVSRDIKNGRAFSESLALYPKVFNPLYISMVQAGEESGKLSEVLRSMAQYQKSQEALKSKVKTALAYPCFMLAAGFLTVYFILSFVMPKLAPLFDNLKNQLPLSTKILLTLSRMMHEYWYIFFAVVLGVTFFSLKYIQSQKGRGDVSRWVLKIPYFGDIILKSELARFTQTLALLLKSGISIVKSLQIAIPILSNDVIKNQLTQSREILMTGGSWGGSLRNSKYLPAMMGHLISVGEESGNLQEVLEDIASTYEEETNEQIKVMTTLLEPVLILFVGGIIGFIVFAMLLPIFQMDVLAN